MRKREKVPKKEKEPIFSSLADELRIPTEVSRGDLKVVLSGNSRAWVENCHGILEFTQERVSLLGRRHKVLLQGTGLSLLYYTKEDLVVLGRIKTVCFEAREGEG